MKHVTIGKNQFVAEIEWRRDNTAFYKRKAAIAKEAKRDGFTYAVPCGFKFKSYQISGYGFIQNTDESRKFNGSPVLAAFIAMKAPNCLSVFPVDPRGENLAIMIIHGGIPIKEMIVPTSSIDDVFDEMYQEYFTEGDLFADVERPSLFLDSSLQSLRKDHFLFESTERIRKRLDSVGFVYRVEDIFADVQDKAPKSVRLRQYKGVNTKTVVWVFLTVATAAGGYFLYASHQAEIEGQARRAAQAAMVARLSGNELQVSQTDIEQAMARIEGRVQDQVLQAYIVNTGSNYPKDWPLRILSLADQIPATIGGFRLRSITCSTIRTRCVVIFNRGDFGVSVADFTKKVDASEYLTDWSVDPNRSSARAHIRFNEGQASIRYPEFESMDAFVQSAILLSDAAERAIESFKFNTTTYTILMEPPESVEFRGQIGQDTDRRLVEEQTLPAHWISIQRANIAGGGQPGILQSMSLSDIKGFGFTEFVVEFDELKIVNSFELSGSLIRHDKSQNSTGRTMQ